MLIYQITHMESGRKYVGQTSRTARRRWHEHLCSLRKDRHPNRYLQAAWNKYGEPAFKFQIIKEVKSLEELNKEEIKIIQEGTDLYNLSTGGNSFKHGTESKKAIGKSNKIPIVGINIKTGEVKEWTSSADAKADGFNPSRIRKCVIGYISKRKDGTVFASISHKGWVWAAKNNFNLNKLQETVEIAKKAKIRIERPVIGMNVFTLQIVEFASASEAGRNGFNNTTVYKSCNVNNSIHRGFVWCYKDVHNPQSLLKEKAATVLSNSSKRGPKSWQYKEE